MYLHTYIYTHFGILRFLATQKCSRTNCASLFVIVLSRYQLFFNFYIFCTSKCTININFGLKTPKISTCKRNSRILFKAKANIKQDVKENIDK